ncbi:hypothetical protein MTP03_46860 [Tsukamurella sp. PLM1]|nr:hypothetical protein MTP03_46860 [Tsukamurella sp. PLM1]
MSESCPKSGSLVTNDDRTELGYMTAVGVEPLYVCLAERGLLPDCQAEGWDDFWSISSSDFGEESDEST